MYLQDHLRPESALRQFFVDPVHRHLDDVARRALHWHIDRHALARSADLEVRRLDLRYVPPPPHHRLGVSEAPAALDCAIAPRADLLVFLEVPADELRGFLSR